MVKRLSQRGDESGVSLVEMLIAMAMFAIVVVAADSSLTVIQERQTYVTNSTEALDAVETAQEAITTDIHAANLWTTPAVPTSQPGSPVTAQTLVFQASLSNVTKLVTITLNTSTHQLQVCTNVTLTTSGCGSGVSGVQLQATLANVDSSSLFTMSTDEVSQTISGLTTNTFFYTAVSSTLTIDSPKVGAPRVSQTTITSPTIVAYGATFSCQTAEGEEGASGTC